MRPRVLGVLDLEAAVVNAHPSFFKTQDERVAPCMGALIDANYNIVWHSPPFERYLDARIATRIEVERRWADEVNSCSKLPMQQEYD